MRYGKSQLILGSAFAFSCTACTSKDPCFEQSNGKQYHINIVELWDQNSQYPGWPGGTNPCPPGFDLAPGGGFDIQITGFNSDSDECSCGKGIVTASPAGWTWEKPGSSEDRCNANFYYAALYANASECKGQVWIGIGASSVPSGVPTPGQVPAARVHRVFTANLSGWDAGTCNVGIGGTCDDHFVVDIEQQ